MWRCLMLGAGGMATGWINNLRTKFAHRVEIVGLVDVDPRVLAQAADKLGLPPDRRFTDMAEAFREVEADFCAVVIPPAFHRNAVLLAAERGMNVLSEKPLADSWEACVDVFRAVKRAGVKMSVIQNYRYNAPMLAFRQVLREGRLGRLNYVVGRFADDYRKYGSWGPFRHEIPHALLVDAAVHHFDMLRNLTGSDCHYMAGWEWNPPWAESQGEFNDLFTMRMTNGVHASYEGSGTAAGTQNRWHHELYRAECENGSVVIDHDQTVRIYQHTPGQGLRMEEVPIAAPRFEGHLWLIDEFLNWLDGGPTPDTVLDENLKTAAMVFAAIEASRSNTVVDVRAMVEAASP